MGSLELLSYFWSLNTILVVKIANFDFDGLSPPPTVDMEEYMKMLSNLRFSFLSFPGF